MKYVALIGLIVSTSCALELEGVQPRDEVSPKVLGDSSPSATGPESDTGGQTAGGGRDAAVAAPDAMGPEYDLCPGDPDKTAPGRCGCGVPEDGCAEPQRECVGPGQCSCSASSPDVDGDQTPDCLDGCPRDPAKTAPGQCGCGHADEDADDDGVVDCVDACVGSYDQSGAPGCACPPTEAACMNALPILSFELPSTDSVEVGELGVQTHAEDPDGEIVSVSLYVDGSLLRTEKHPPYNWGRANPNFPQELKGLPQGKHLLRVEAIDDDGAMTWVAMDVTIYD